MLHRRSLFEMATAGLLVTATGRAAQAQDSVEDVKRVFRDVLQRPSGPDSPARIARGPRDVPYVDFETAAWTTNEFGVDVLMLSVDDVSGAVTMALRTPKDLDYPEEAHFYDCDQDLFQFEGTFHHDPENPYEAGDYIYRPPGTVYGHNNGSGGGIILVSLNRQLRRFHSQDHDTDRGPWRGEYLVDEMWNPRRVASMKGQSSKFPWLPSELHPALQVKQMRGAAGHKHPLFGATVHSPWGADAASLFKFEAGFEGELPLWPDTSYEVLVLGGKAEIAGQDWHRGVYHFGRWGGAARIVEDLVCYVRSFSDLQA